MSLENPGSQPAEEVLPTLTVESDRIESGSDMAETTKEETPCAIWDHEVDRSELDRMVNENKEKCNDTELLIERLHNQEIIMQRIALFQKHAELDIENEEGDVWEPADIAEVAKGSNDSKIAKWRKFWKTKRMWGTVDKYLERPFHPAVAPTALDVEADLLERERISMTSTAITLDANTPNTENQISINWCAPGMDKPYDAKQKSIVSAHEKGHILRPYTGMEWFFSHGFDTEDFEYSEEDHESDMRMMIDAGEDPIKDINQAREMMMGYLFSAEEIAERMSQLKNFFGLKGSEPFTRSHLDYARKHYVEVTGVDNMMSRFFKAITPITEYQFLRIINTGGI